MIAAVNELETDAWLQVPNLVNDDYVRQLARLWLADMGPGRRLYVEYSNEVWNPDHEVFPQGAWVQDRGVDLGLADDPVLASTRFQAKRSAEIFAVFEEEWVGQRDRLVFVLAPWIAFPDRAEELVDAFGRASVNGVPVNPFGVSADVLAIGVYVGYSIPDEIYAAGAVGSTSVADVLTTMRFELNDEIRDLTFAHADVARENGLDLEAYEGGQHLTPHGAAPNDEELQALVLEVTRDPGMYDFCHELLDMWDGAGVGCLWPTSPYGGRTFGGRSASLSMRRSLNRMRRGIRR